MALATRCPHCDTTFRVAADQLKLRGGIVRCGSCNQIFDGQAALVEPAPPDSPPEMTTVGAGSLPGMADASADARADAASAPADGAAAAPTGLDSFAEALENMLQAQAPEPAIPDSASAPPDDPVDAQGLPVLSHPQPAAEAAAPPAPVIDLERGPLPLLRQASIAAYDVPAPPPAALPPVAKPSPRVKTAKAPKPAPPKPPEPPEPENDEPQFVKQSRELERTGRTRSLAMIAGSVALALLLIVQGITTFRNVLVARFPGLNPAIATACAALGCSVELPAHIEALSIETGELQTIAPNTFVLITLLRNQSELSQAWPHIELELTDATDKALVRRVFSPGEYLPPATPAAQGFGARSEQGVKLYFELKQLKASGYHIAVFYP